MTVTLSFLLMFFSIGVGISGIIDGKLQTFGVVGDASCGGAGDPPLRFKVNLSPPYCTIFTQIDGKMIKTHKRGEKKDETKTIRNVKR